MAHWLLKSEPGTYSWDRLVREKRTAWDGITNTTALIHLRNFAVGDEAFFYHSGEERRIVGVARVVKAAYPDPAKNDPKLVAVDIEAVGPVKKPVDLATLKATPALEGWDLFRISRLSVVPVSAAHWRVLMKLAGGVG